MADTPAGTTTDHHQPADASPSLRVLVVDDHALVRSGVRSELTAHAPDLDVVAEADDVEGAIAAVHALRPDVVLLDVMLPGFDGLEVCRRIQAERPVPVLMLTARDDETDMLVGLGVGADDYMTKPFSIRELVARLKALLRRVRRAGRRHRGRGGVEQHVAAPPNGADHLGRPASRELAAQLADDRDWFIQKAIAWWLRDLSKRDAPRVRAFLEAHGARMKPFARKEALRLVQAVLLPEQRQGHARPA